MDDTVTVWVDGAEIAQLTVPGLPGGSGKPGVRYNQNAGASLYSLSYRTANNLQSLAEDDIVTETSIASTGDNAMKVILDKDFSRGFGVFENFISGPNHMSESSAFTDDVIDGRYSLKILNMEGKSQNMAQTVPSTLRFPENTKCTVSVNYMVSNGGGYTLSAWEGETKLGEVALPATGMGQGANAPKAELSFTTGDTGKVQLRINRTNGTLILDNLAVQIDENSQGAKQAITATATGNGTVEVKQEQVTMGQDAQIVLKPNDSSTLVKSVVVNGVSIPVPNGNTILCLV